MNMTAMGYGIALYNITGTTYLFTKGIFLLYGLYGVSMYISLMASERTSM